MTDLEYGHEMERLNSLYEELLEKLRVFDNEKVELKNKQLCEGLQNLLNEL